MTLFRGPVQAAPAEPCNTFAVPTVIAPIEGPERVVWEPDGPLVPWQVAGADDLWVEIDHTRDLLRRFEAEGPQPDRIIDRIENAGHLVVVSGPRQSGKTTLLHKAVHSLALRLDDRMRTWSNVEQLVPAQERWTARSPQELSHVRVVALAGPRNAPAHVAWAAGRPLDVDQVHDRILRKVRETLGKPEVEDGHPPGSEDLYVAYERLSRQLIEDRTVLLILLPDFGWGGEGLTGRFYRSCRDNARCGIVFFVESRNDTGCADDLRTAFGDELGTENVTHLALGPMAEGDWRDFIDARHRAAIPGAAIRVAAEVTDGAPALLTGASVGKLRKVLYAATQHAHENRRDEVDAATLRAVGRAFEVPGPDQFRRDGASRQQTEEPRP
ncbi:P-loop NTPase family protein [Actinacidiphila yeochonensis]|uniref:ATP-binding protein n=1 Tax=Actinacidiphila yeochonensis TaxID=89050 RepID=UPI00055CBD1F|nr:ATP-binding protein [Actinacidiphila yeochonensis]